MFVPTTTTLTILALLTTTAHAAIINVQVGLNGALAFTPNTVTAAAGDFISFSFMAGMHSVTQSTFASPCSRLVNSATGVLGFDSGFVPGNATAPPAITVQVPSTSPVWVYCRQATHCSSAGMVFAVNPPATGNTFDAFLNAAKNSVQGTTTTTAAVGPTPSAFPTSMSVVDAPPTPTPSPAADAGTTTTTKIPTTTGTNSAGPSSSGGSSSAPAAVTSKSSAGRVAGMAGGVLAWVGVVMGLMM